MSWGGVGDVAREVIEELTCRRDGDGRQQQLMEQQGWQELGSPHGAGGPPRRLAGRRWLLGRTLCTAGH